MAEENVWTIVNEAGVVITNIGNCDKEHAETIKAQLEPSYGALKLRKGRKHHVQDEPEEEG